MRALFALAMLLLLTGASYAQGAINLMQDEKRRTPEEREKDQQIEQDYRAKMKNIPDQKAPADPWGSVRSTDTTKAAPAARKPKQN